MKTKIFTITKTGYSAGVYGCSAEYFTCIYTKLKPLYKEPNKKELVMKRFTFEGMYGAEERVREAMEQKGFNYFYTGSNYGKISKKEVSKNTMSESEAIEYIKNNFKNNV